MLARDLMNASGTIVRSQATIGESARLMRENKVSRLLALNEQRQLVDMLTHTDFGLHSQSRPLANNIHSPLGRFTSPKHTQEFSQKVSGKLAKDVMHLPVNTINDDAPFPEVMQLFLDPKSPGSR